MAYRTGTMAATSAGTGGEVRLVDLDVIKRYSLAVRQEWAPADEVLAALDATRDAVLHALGLEPDREASDGGGLDATGPTRATFAAGADDVDDAFGDEPDDAFGSGSPRSGRSTGRRERGRRSGGGGRGSRA